MAILLALVSALCYGTSDFIGGVLSARLKPWTAAFTGQFAGGALLGLLCVVRGTALPVAAVGWGALAGLGGGIGIIYLYRGLSTGRMGVVAPLSGVLAALVPAAVGILTGDRPSAIRWSRVTRRWRYSWSTARASSPSLARCACGTTS